MLIRVGYDIIFDHPVATPIVAMLYLHPSRQPTIRRNEYLLVDPQTPISEYVDGFGNRCGRLTSPAGLCACGTTRWSRTAADPRQRPAASNERSTTCRTTRSSS